MDDKAKKFLEDNFKAGDYVAMTILVKNAEFDKFLTYLKVSGLTLAVMPNVPEDTEKTDTSH